MVGFVPGEEGRGEVELFGVGCCGGVSESGVVTEGRDPVVAHYLCLVVSRGFVEVVCCDWEI